MLQDYLKQLQHFDLLLQAEETITIIKAEKICIKSCTLEAVKAKLNI